MSDTQLAIYDAIVFKHGGPVQSVKSFAKRAQIKLARKGHEGQTGFLPVIARR